MTTPFQTSCMKITRWFDRKFPSLPDNGIFHNIVERLEGTPIRLRHKVAGIPNNILSRNRGDQWSIKEEVGHLYDLEALWYGRYLDFAAGKEELRPADLSNRKTHEANHNQMPIEDLLTAFEAERKKLLSLLRGLSAADLEVSALHPRLLTPMRPIDLTYFIAEHDDQHLAQITRLLEVAS
jgi:uncharacterized damage-inducible protein DinB